MRIRHGLALFTLVVVVLLVRGLRVAFGPWTHAGGLPGVVSRLAPEDAGDAGCLCEADRPAQPAPR
jgi:hypothetical protein